MKTNLDNADYQYSLKNIALLKAIYISVYTPDLSCKSFGSSAETSQIERFRFMLKEMSIVSCVP